jgi:sarcosine oxidase
VTAADYDAVVVGVGGMGSAAVYHLARRGARVLGLEQFDIPHDRGSSHGTNRIIRLAYMEHPSYVPLLRRAYELWREVEGVAGERLLVITGSIDAGPSDGEIVKGSVLSCELHRLPHEVLDAAALHRRFPGYRLPAEMVGVYQPDGGFLMSERAIVAHVEAAQTHGADVRAREPVLDWTLAAGGVEVRTSRGRYRASRIVFTAGAWIGALVPGLRRVAAPERQVLLWTQPLRPELFRLGAFPVFNMEGPEGRFYGFPVYGVPGFKIGKYHHRLEQVDPSGYNRDVDAGDEALLREGIRHYFPDADGPTMAMKTCLFTNTPDEHFILDRHPDVPEAIVASPCSGHGYKFCSVIGEILADLALDGDTRHDIALHRLRRLTPSGGEASPR